MYFIITAILTAMVTLSFISNDTYSRTAIISIGVMVIVMLVVFKVIERMTTRKTKLLFGPIKEQMDNLKSKTKEEYTGVFTLVDTCGMDSLFKYTPLKSQQPPIAEYIIFHRNDLVTVLTVYKPDLKSIIEFCYNAESFNLIGYVVLYKKAMWSALER